jgi:DNA-binding XRE family transcriptional regulator
MDPRNIAQVRNKLKLTQKEFAQLLDVHHLTVYKWEKGEAIPTNYQIGLITEFEKAANNKDTKSTNIGAMIIAAGVIAVLFFLLSKSRKESK